MSDSYFSLSSAYKQKDEQREQQKLFHFSPQEYNQKTVQDIKGLWHSWQACDHTIERDRLTNQEAHSQSTGRRDP